MTDPYLAKCCPGCGDLGVHQVVNEFDDPEWCLADLRDEEGDPLFVCYCPYCGRQLQDPRTAPVRVSLNAVKQVSFSTRTFAPMGLELGLRWLHDRAEEQYEYIDVSPPPLRDCLAQLELSLRWLGDRGATRWRRGPENLPEKDTPVLTWVEGWHEKYPGCYNITEIVPAYPEGPRILNWDAGEGITWALDEPTYWMPLPEPP